MQLDLPGGQRLWITLVGRVGGVEMAEGTGGGGVKIGHNSWSHNSVNGKDPWDLTFVITTQVLELYISGPCF